MNNFFKSPPLIWLVQIEPTSGSGIYETIFGETSSMVERKTLSTALIFLSRGIKPSVIFLEGPPGKSLQSAMAQINVRQPSVRIFVISHWPNASEMRSWFTRYFVESARANSRRKDKPTNTYRLSSREMEILRLMVRGLIKKEIAEQLSISYHTVDNHERKIFSKLNIHTRTEAVAKALIEKLC